MANSGTANIEEHYEDVLVNILENFHDLADEAREAWHSKFIDEATYKVQESFMMADTRDAKGQPAICQLVETGSSVEGVAAVSTRGITLKPFDYPKIFPMERDIMVVRDIDNLLTEYENYRLESIPDFPAFLKIYSTSEVGSKELIASKYYMEMKAGFENGYEQLKTWNKISKICAIKAPIVASDTSVSLKVTFHQELQFSEEYSGDNADEEISTRECLMDLVPSIRIPDWPDQAEEWRARERQWPEKQVIDDIVSSGVLLVKKGRKEGDQIVTDWRLSFSEAEVKLISNRRGPCKQHAHKIFKYIIKHMVNPLGEEKILTSYHCKTILLWMCETKYRPNECDWIWEDLAKYVMGLLQAMSDAIRKGVCEHYFIRQLNLFADISDLDLARADKRIWVVLLKMDFSRAMHAEKTVLYTKSSIPVVCHNFVGEIPSKSESDMLRKFGIVWWENATHECYYAPTQTAIQEDTMNINKLLLRYKFKYSQASVDKIEKHLLENKRRSEQEANNEYKTRTSTLPSVIGEENIPPGSLYHSAGLRKDATPDAPLIDMEDPQTADFIKKNFPEKVNIVIKFIL